MIDLIATLNDALKDTYVLQRELGRGGMATVFLADDVKHGRSVAIKVLHPEVAASMGQDRFLREIEIAARLQHPHILPLYDSGAAGPYFYYVMPFVEGESLRDRLNREKQLSQEDTLRLSPVGWRARWPTPTAGVWCIATSSPRTSCSRVTRPSWRTSASRAPRGVGIR